MSTPDKLDLSAHNGFIRCQTGRGCWAFATAACLDIMHNMATPFSPHVSLRRWFWTFDHKFRYTAGLYLPYGKRVSVGRGTNEPNAREPDAPCYFEVSGFSTEGSEPTRCNKTVPGFEPEGFREEENYRWTQAREAVELSSKKFEQAIANGHPIRVSGGVHVVAFVGYDRIQKTFKVQNSDGDLYGTDGYTTVSYDDIDNKNSLPFFAGEVSEAYIFHPIPPKPVPAARFDIRHSVRSNVKLSIGYETISTDYKSIPGIPKDVWNEEWDEKKRCRNLRLTVRLPAYVPWPPQQGNRIVLHLEDTARHTNTGGSIHDFTVAFGNKVIPCPMLENGPIHFNAGDLLKLTIP